MHQPLPGTARRPIPGDDRPAGTVPIAGEIVLSLAKRNAIEDGYGGERFI